jgi:hypothetical protein
LILVLDGDRMRYAPEFYLKKIILDSFPQGVLPNNVADAVDFAVAQVTLIATASRSVLSHHCRSTA